MKYPTVKRRSRSWLRRALRGFWRWVDELTHNEFDGLPQTLDDFNAGRHGR